MQSAMFGGGPEGEQSIEATLSSMQAGGGGE
jgi:hypothetical protein